MASEILSNLQLGSLILNGSKPNTITSTTGALMTAPTVTITDSATAASGTLLQFHGVYIGAPTLTATNTGVTTTTANTLTISGAPTAGTNETITTNYALNVLGGTTNLASAVNVGGTLTTAVIAPTNATTGLRLGLTTLGSPSGNINYNGQFMNQSSSAVASNYTFTAAQVINGVFIRNSGANGSYTDTFPTAAQLWAACNQIAGATFTFTMCTLYSNYITAGTGGNLNGGVLGNSANGFSSYSGASIVQNNSPNSSVLLPNSCTYTFTFVLQSASSYCCLLK